MPRLTTHVLDTAAGLPAAGLRVVLRFADSAAVLADTTTNADGRAGPLIEGVAFARGGYELTFHVGDYFCKRRAAVADPAFLDIVPVRFSCDGAGDVHIPLLIAPYGYSTYRGS
jgi:5-hydroxyisourate hydrolase